MKTIDKTINTPRRLQKKTINNIRNKLEQASSNPFREKCAFFVNDLANNFLNTENLRFLKLLPS